MPRKHIRFTKPTTDEAQAYMAQEPKPCYPLYRWAVGVPGATERVAVEDLHCWSKDAPQVEAIMPRGFVGGDADLHTILGFSLKDLEQSLLYGMHPCTRNAEDGCCDPA